MRARTASSSLYAAGLTAILAAALAGCAATSSGTAATSSGTAATSSGTAATSTPSSPLDAVRLAAQTTGGASSFTAAMSLRATAKSGATGSDNVSMTATIAEQLHPSLLAEVRIGTLQAAGSTLPGGLDEIATPGTIYLKWSFLTQELHLTKPWLGIPLSSLSKGTGIDFSQLFSQATSSGPLSESQMLAGADKVRKVGQGTVDGVAVTEYAGTLSLDKGMQYLSGSVKSQVQKEIAAAGLTTATFTVWIDGQRVIRKAVIVEDGTALTETITFTVDTLNQPVNIAVPAPDQTSPLPSSALSSLG
jgi:hypothetical protein